MGSAYGNRNDSDQPAHQHSLVRAMAVHKKHVLVLTLINECAWNELDNQDSLTGFQSLQFKGIP